MAKSKLQNVKAVKEMLSGAHKSQTSKTFGYSEKTNKKRNIGDTWIETKPNGTKIHWEQKDGFRVKKSENSILQQINNIVQMPNTCPKCNSNMYGNEERLNKKFWKINKTCFDCVIVEETKLRAEGKYKDYEREKLYNNAEAFFKDADKEVDVLKAALVDKLKFVQNADGDVEEFDQSESNKKYINYIDTQYNRFKKQTLSELKSDNMNKTEK